MNITDKKLIIEKLISEKEKIENQIIELKELTKPIAPENAIGRVSRMDAINNKSVNEAALRKAIEKLKAINISLEQSENTNFGQCRKCGNDIPVGRLLIMPGSSTCVRCASI